MGTSFVIGNGISRLQVDLNVLKDKGYTYGCNRLYQDFTPDYLIATDKPMAREIQESGYALTNRFYTRDPIKDMGAIKIEKNYGYSSGPVALTYACLHGHKKIYIVGFDLMGKGKINQKDKKINNIYADTTHYKTSDSKEVYYGNWITQVRDIMKEYNNRKFIRVNPYLNYTPPEWEQQNNYSEMSLDKFMKKINT